MMTLRQRLRALAYRNVGGTALVLIYHRVADLPRDPQLLAADPATFESHMQMLRERFHVMRLGDLAEGLRHRSVPRRSVVVTLDDGYADNLHIALPVLARHGAPATVFVSSGYVGAGREFWWDELDRLLLAPGTLPTHLELASGDARFSATLAHSATYLEDDAARFSDWNVTEAGGGERQRLYADLCEFVRPLAVAQRDDVLAQLRAAAGVEESVRESHRPLSLAELREVDASGILEVGGHTSDHVFLASQTADGQRAQIEGDRARLTELLGHAPTSFSYPYGGLDAYTDESVSIASAAGYTGACSNHTGAVKPWTDPLRIPRITVGEVDAETLAAQLEGWFDEPR